MFISYSLNDLENTNNYII